MGIKRQENIELICEGCEKFRHETLSCSVYVDIPPYYLRCKCCPFNMPETKVEKKRVRVGQQKQKAAAK